VPLAVIRCSVAQDLDSLALGITVEHLSWLSSALETPVVDGSGGHDTDSLGVDPVPVDNWAVKGGFLCASAGVNVVKSQLGTSSKCDRLGRGVHCRIGHSDGNAVGGRLGLKVNDSDRLLLAHTKVLVRTERHIAELDVARINVLVRSQLDVRGTVRIHK